MKTPVFPGLRSPLLLSAALIAAGLVSVPAHADGLRCPRGGLVSTGDTTAEVLSKCGEPTDRTVTTSVPCRRIGRCPVAIEDWRYDFGPTSFVRLLTFDAGRLVRITMQGYGGR